jgi:hypothetical protein
MLDHLLEQLGSLSLVFVQGYVNTSQSRQVILIHGPLTFGDEVEISLLGRFVLSPVTITLFASVDHRRAPPTFLATLLPLCPLFMG